LCLEKIGEQWATMILAGDEHHPGSSGWLLEVVAFKK